MERLARRHFRKLLPQGERPPSGNALWDGMDRVDLGALQRLFVAVMMAANGMKTVLFLDGWRVAAIDGPRFFASTLCKCEDCRAQHRRDSRTTYDQPAVFCHGVGPVPRLFRGYEPGEGGRRPVCGCFHGYTPPSSTLWCWFSTRVLRKHHFCSPPLRLHHPA